MMGGVTRRGLSHIPGIPHLHVNRPLGPCRVSVNFLDCPNRKPTEVVPAFLYLS